MHAALSYDSQRHSNLYTPGTPPVPQARSVMPASSVVWRGLACRVEMVSPVIGYQERQELWLSQDALRDSSSWSSSPLLLLRDIHSKLLTQYDCKEVCAPSQSQDNVGPSARLSSKDGVPQQEAAPLSLP